MMDGDDFDGEFIPTGNQFDESASPNASVLKTNWESPLKSSKNRFDFSFPTPEPSILNNGGCDDSPDRFLNHTFNNSNYAHHWNASNGSDSSAPFVSQALLLSLPIVPCFCYKTLKLSFMFTFRKTIRQRAVATISMMLQLWATQSGTHHRFLLTTKVMLATAINSGMSLYYMN